MLQDPFDGENSEGRCKNLQNLLFALGSNLASPAGTPVETLRAALSEIENHGAVIRAVSPFYSTPAFPPGNGPDFVNAAASICAPFGAHEALTLCHEIEAALARQRGTRWGARTVDIDLIACGDLVLPDAETHQHWRNLSVDRQMAKTPDRLILPHPRLQDRAFVLVPLADIAPDWRHPLLDRTVREMRDALPKKALEEVCRLE